MKLFVRLHKNPNYLSFLSLINSVLVDSVADPLDIPFVPLNFLIGTGEVYVEIFSTSSSNSDTTGMGAFYSRLLNALPSFEACSESDDNVAVFARTRSAEYFWMASRLRAHQKTNIGIGGSGVLVGDFASCEGSNIGDFLFSTTEHLIGFRGLLGGFIRGNT